MTIQTAPKPIFLGKILGILLIFVLSFTMAFCGWNTQVALAAPSPDPTICPPNRTLSPLEKQLRGEVFKDPSINTPNILNFSTKFLAYEGCPEEMGAWAMLPMPENEADRMQAVHAVLLADNTVLILNGSSNRNRADKVAGRDPTNNPPDPLLGEIAIGNAVYKMQDGVDTYDYDAVNNTSIFDPSLSDPYYKQIQTGNSAIKPDFTTLPFTRISSPPSKVKDTASGKDESNDPFCSGHLQLPNGDVLFVGGSRFYYPGSKFQGSKIANLYHSQSKTWDTPVILPDGHWYPTLVPLPDGAIAAFSGLSAERFDQISPIVEIFDPNQTNPDLRWQHLDISNLPNTPLRRRMNAETTTPDLIDLYPRIFPTKDGRFLITGDGGGKVPLLVHKSTHSYFAKFTKNADGKYAVSFEYGPERQAVSKVYGSASLDPNSKNGDVLLYGGIIGTNDISYGPGKYAIRGASMTGSVERWIAPTEGNTAGQWTIDEDFLARVDEDILQKSAPGYKDPQYSYVKQSSNLGRYGTRAMQVAVILPTKQVLVVNGGNYAERLPVVHPTLLTPDSSKDPSKATDHLGFKTRTLNPDIQPRLYHNTAILLPDARVLVMGGNNSRATRFVSDDPAVNGKVELNTFNDFSFTPKGAIANTAEIYQQAVFYPPYLFGQGARPEIDGNSGNTLELKYGETKTISVSNASADNDSLVLIKFGSVTHAFDNGQRLVELEKTKLGTGQIQFTVPTDKHFSPPGHYMLFYVNAAGTPSHAQIVKLS
jgi:hypothetical protein